MTQTALHTPDFTALLPGALTDHQPGHTPQTGDSFGAMLHDCWAQGGARHTVHEVCETIEGEVRTGDVGQYYFTEADHWTPMEQEAARRATGRVLDGACRAGTRALHLAQQTAVQEVVGIEFSPGAVEVARQRGVNAHIGTVHHLPAGLGTFDTITILGEAQGVLGNAQQAPAALRSLAALATPDTTLIYQGTDPYRSPKQKALSHYFTTNREQDRLPGTLRIRVRYRLLTTPWFDYLFCSAEEFTHLTQGTGWTITRIEEDDWQYLVTLKKTTT